MRDQWRLLCGQLGIDGDRFAVDAVFDELVRCYREPPRHYHMLDHIQHCLAEFAPVRSVSLEPNLIEAAIWFHDAAYDPRAADNEERSADLAQRTLRKLAAPESIGEVIRRLILV